jgi:hypothetical protein
MADTKMDLLDFQSSRGSLSELIGEEL